MSNIIHASFNGARITQTDPVYQWDYGQILIFDDLDLPSAYEVHFSNERHCGDSLPEIGNAEGVEVPDELLETGKSIFAFVFLHTGESDGETEYMATIPVIKRAKKPTTEPTPVQQDAITEAIAALQEAERITSDNVTLAAGYAAEAEGYRDETGRHADDAEDAKAAAVQAKNDAETAVSHYPIIIDDYWYEWSTQQGAYINTGTKAKGDDGGGVPAGGTTGQVLAKKSDTDFDTDWIDQSGQVTSVNGKTGAVTLTASDVNALPSNTDLSVYMQKGTDYVTAGQKAGTSLDANATAEGYDTTASGEEAHAEGYMTVASGDDSHAEGDKSTASGDYSHAEGYYTEASGDGAHAEGTSTHAIGNGSHAEGSHTYAYGYYSHVEGYQTTASAKSQHVFGECNTLDPTGTASTRGTYIEIVGNGSGTSARSNARTLDWSGNEELQGDLTLQKGTANEMNVRTAINAKYTKPSGGIPATDLASAVQTSLGKADTALQSFTESDPTVPSWAKAQSKPSYTASEVGAIAAPSSPATGAFLVWNGSAWVAQTLSTWQGGNY